MSGDASHCVCKGPGPEASITWPSLEIGVHLGSRTSLVRFLTLLKADFGHLCFEESD